MEIRWQKSAISDLQAIQDYLLERNPPAALRLISDLREAALSLIDHPKRGRPGRVPGTRELVVSGTTYLIPYRVRGEVIEIMRVFHGARKWPDDFGK